MKTEQLVEGTIWRNINFCKTMYFSYINYQSVKLTCIELEMYGELFENNI